MSLTDVFELAPTAVAVCSAIATAVAALLVLHAVDLRTGGWITAAGWLLVAVCAPWCAAAAVLSGVAVPWPLAMLGVALAVLVWLDLDALMCRASCAHARGYVPLPDPSRHVQGAGMQRHGQAESRP